MTDEITAEDTADSAGPQTFIEAVGLSTTGEHFDRISSFVLLEFVNEIIGRWPNFVLQEIANNQNADIRIQTPGADTAVIHADR